MDELPEIPDDIKTIIRNLDQMHELLNRQTGVPGIMDNEPNNSQSMDVEKYRAYQYARATVEQYGMLVIGKEYFAALTARAERAEAEADRLRSLAIEAIEEIGRSYTAYEAEAIRSRLRAALARHE